MNVYTSLPYSDRATDYVIRRLNLTSETQVFTTPMFPFSSPHRNLPAMAQPKFCENPNSSSEKIVPQTPSNITGLLPRMSDSHPHVILPAKLPM